MPPGNFKHVLDGWPAKSGLVGLILGGWQRPECLAIILLMQTTPTASHIGSVESFHKQEGSVAGFTGGDIRRRDFHAACQRQAEGLVVNPAWQARRIRLEDMRRGRAVHWNTDAAAFAHRHRQLWLRARERHRYSLVSDEERFVRQILQDTFEIMGCSNRSPLNR